MSIGPGGSIVQTGTHARSDIGTKINRGVHGAVFPQQRQWSAHSLISKEILPSTTLFVQGAPSGEVIYLERGLVKLIRLNENGQDFGIGLQSSGSLLGAASVIVQEPYPSTAVTVTKCVLIRIPADLFLELARTDEQLCWYLHEFHSLEVHRHAGQLAAFTQLSARQRFERLLLQLISSTPATERQNSMKLQLPLRHWEIAQLIGVRPEHLSRILQQVKQDGILHEENGCMIVSDIKKLHSRCSLD